jgi:competence protein ComEA
VDHRATDRHSGHESPSAAIVDWIRWVGPRRIAVAIIAIAIGGAAVWWLLRPAPPVADAVLTTIPIESLPPGPAVVPETIMVHVTGAVTSPGVVEVDASARIQDVVAAAGGALGRADLDAVNLAAPVSDGAQVHIPAIGEVPGLASGLPITGGPSTPVNLNTADLAALDALPGIGPSTAAAIVKRRTEVGRFVSIDDLLDVPGIGPAKVDAWRDLVVVS